MRWEEGGELGGASNSLGRKKADSSPPDGLQRPNSIQRKFVLAILMSEVLTIPRAQLTGGRERKLTNECTMSIAIPLPLHMRNLDINSLHVVIKAKQDLALGVGRLLTPMAAAIRRRELEKAAEPGDGTRAVAQGTYAHTHKQGPKKGHFVFVNTRINCTDVMAKELDRLAEAAPGKDAGLIRLKHPSLALVAAITWVKRIRPQTKRFVGLDVDTDPQALRECLEKAGYKVLAVTDVPQDVGYTLVDGYLPARGKLDVTFAADSKPPPKKLRISDDPGVETREVEIRDVRTQAPTLIPGTPLPGMDGYGFAAAAAAAGAVASGPAGGTLPLAPVNQQVPPPPPGQLSYAQALTLTPLATTAGLPAATAVPATPAPAPGAIAPPLPVGRGRSRSRKRKASKTRAKPAQAPPAAVSSPVAGATPMVVEAASTTCFQVAAEMCLHCGKTDHGYDTCPARATGWAAPGGGADSEMAEDGAEPPAGEVRTAAAETASPNQDGLAA